MLLCHLLVGAANTVDFVDPSLCPYVCHAYTDGCLVVGQKILFALYFQISTCMYSVCNRIVIAYIHLKFYWLDLKLMVWTNRNKKGSSFSLSPFSLLYLFKHSRRIFCLKTMLGFGSYISTNIKRCVKYSVSIMLLWRSNFFRSSP